MEPPIEHEIQRRASLAPRVTPAQVEASIASEHYFTAGEAVIALDRGFAPEPLLLLTICVLVLNNGFTVTGESACASPENFDAEIGRTIARDRALQKIWPLLGFQLRTELSRPVLTEGDAAADLAGTPRPSSQAAG